ncbi:MAG: NAD(P)/FAD-dependent oxidoreductase, partial [Candidatus Altiarchaeota archaeon]
MIKVQYDLAIVGGGPIGCYGAANVQKTNDVILFEEHKRQPIHCSGIISVSGLSKLGIKPKSSLIHKVRGAKIYSPSSVELIIEDKKPRAYILERSAFDQELLNQALDRGVDVRFERIQNIKDTFLTGTKNSYEAEKTVLATGVDYALQKKLGFKSPKKFLIGAQYDLKLECDSDFVELHLNNPDFFNWIIPTGDLCRVGLATKDNPTPHLEAFVKSLRKEGRLRSDKIKNKTYGVIPIHDPALATSKGNQVLVGDAAGQLKATTGGGVVMGCLASRHLSNPDYENAWRADIGGELKKHLFIRRFLNRLTPKGKDKLVELL